MSADVTQLLAAVQRREALASEDLLPLVYDELRRLAAAKLACEPPGQTLQATALVHEAYLRLVRRSTKGTPSVDSARSEWAHRGHFFAAAAEAMRRILVESARRKGRLKHGGEFERIELADVAIAVPLPNVDLLALDEALTHFAVEEPQKAELVKLRFFAGLSEDEAAAALNISRPTAARWWAYSRAWLFDRLR